MGFLTQGNYLQNYLIKCYLKSDKAMYRIQSSIEYNFTYL